MMADAMDRMDKADADDHELEMSLRIIMTKHSDGPLEPDYSDPRREYGTAMATEPEETAMVTEPLTEPSAKATEATEVTEATTEAIEAAARGTEIVMEPRRVVPVAPDYADLGPLMDELAGDWRVALRADIKMRLLARPKREAAATVTVPRGEKRTGTSASASANVGADDGTAKARPSKQANPDTRRVLFSPAPTIIKHRKHKHKRGKEKSRKSRKSRKSSKEQMGQ